MILEKGEHISAEVRKHWFLYIARIWPAVLAAILPPLVILVLALGGAQPPGAFTSSHIFLGVFLYSMFLLILWMVVFVHWTDHYLDEWIVTQTRIIDIDQRGLFHREITSMRLDRVQDVTVEVPGFLATLFNFGELRVQSAGDVQELIIRGIHNPLEVKRILTRQINEARERPQEVTFSDQRIAK